MSSEYTFLTGGSLKLKGGKSEGGVVKKKKKSKLIHDATTGRDREREKVKDLLFQDDGDSKQSGSDRNSPAVGGSNSNSTSDRKTEAERRFEEVQKKRLAQRVAKMAGKTHKDRVAEFNAHLDSLSEHHDIPKVGPG
ncbi:DUF1754-domain-containing protein [Fistulina hepatica ATCC 64428]|uniref:DUF1754-domain-containing protein n=1 Tax=Fistulina hepatica ATCC 64428 TaxID=1128425 RepID=A0A0D7AJ19_9AGAR|nr:DUF1754-domain-containing protein [Fistulina hepatica ATCC 64428]